MSLPELVGGIIVLHFTPIPWVIYYAAFKWRPSHLS